MCPVHYLTAITLLYRNYMVQASVVSLVEKCLERKIFIWLVNLSINIHYSHPQTTHINATLSFIYKDLTSRRKTASVVRLIFPTSLRSWVTNTPSVKMLCTTTKFLVLTKHNMLKCWSTEDWSSFFCLL